MGRAAFVTVLTALALCAATARAATPPRVTVFGDSVFTAVEWNEAPLRILEQGLDVQLEVGVCRRLVGQSCPFDGQRVPTLVDCVQKLGDEVAPSVVVEVGYNDDPDTFASAVERSLAALRIAGAREVRWLTLRETKLQYARMNGVLRDAAARHPELTLVDWNAYSGNHPEWFQSDGEHLGYGGAFAMASIVHASLLAPAGTVVGAITLAQPPPPRTARPYAARLDAAGGVGPYTFRVVGGRPPGGLHLLANGRLYGTPRRPGTAKMIVEVRDALNTAVLSAVTFRVR